MEHEELIKISDLIKDKRIQSQPGRHLNKTQRLALEIIKYCNVEKKMIGRWFRICKSHTAFVEQKFLDFKKTDKKSAAYLFRMIYPHQK